MCCEYIRLKRPKQVNEPREVDKNNKFVYLKQGVTQTLFIQMTAVLPI